MPTSLLKTVALCLLLLAALTACHTIDPDLIPLRESAKAWVHEQDGQQLVFQNTSNGALQTVQVNRRDTVEKLSQKLGARIPNEYLYLTYQRPAVADSGFSVVVYERELVFTRSMEPRYNSGGNADRALLATLVTADVESEEGVAGPKGRLVRNQSPYTSLVRLEALAEMVPYNQPSDLEEAYYSKHHGLVGFKTRDGLVWQRQ